MRDTFCLIFAGNPQRLTDCLKKLKQKECSGEFSLQNSLEMAHQTLRHVPKHTSKEVRTIMLTHYFLYMTTPKCMTQK